MSTTSTRVRSIPAGASCYEYARSLRILSANQLFEKLAHVRRCAYSKSAPVREFLALQLREEMIASSLRLTTSGELKAPNDRCEYAAISKGQDRCHPGVLPSDILAQVERGTQAEALAFLWLIAKRCGWLTTPPDNLSGMQSLWLEGHEFAFRAGAPSA